MDIRNFERFNRDTEVRYKAGSQLKCRVNRKRNYVLFTAAAVAALDLVPEGGVELLRLGRNWFVCKTTQGKGYRLTAPVVGEGLRCVCTIPVAELVKDLTQLDESQEYYLQKTKHELDEEPLFELVKKPDN